MRVYLVVSGIEGDTRANRVDEIAKSGVLSLSRVG